MLEVTHKQRATFRQPKAGTRQANGDAEWEAVQLDGVLLRLKCKFTERKAKATTKDNAEVTADATMVWRDRGTFTLTTEHLVVMGGVGYAVLSIEDEPSLFGSARYRRARLAKTLRTFPEDESDGE